MHLNKKILGYIVLTVALCYGVIAYWSTGAGLLNTIYTATLPFIMGAGIAYIVNIVMSGYEKIMTMFIKWKVFDKFKRPLSLFLAYFTFVLVVFMIFNIVLPDLISSIQSLLSFDPSVIQDWLKDLQDNKLVAKALEYMGGDSQIVSTLTSYGQQILKQILSTLTGVLTSVSSIASTLLNVFVSVIFSIYVLASKEDLGRQCRLLIDTYTGHFAEKIYYVVNVLHKRFHGFFVGQTLEACILGTLCYIGMLIFNFSYAATISVLLAFTALIPVVGGYIGVVVGAILIMTQSPMQALYFVIYVVVLQQFEGNLIYPRVVGGSIGLPAMWVLLSITLGGALGGILGMLVAVPFAASLYQILKDYTYEKIAEQETIPVSDSDDSIS
ncbi:AI-2E family transporter [Streptococcus caprae]|uniref:AI-2E family transporter n=1 Tax=Streptococcus caprae TaxID=1640501 RepID=A0ABV8CU48_9STRE